MPACTLRVDCKQGGTTVKALPAIATVTLAIAMAAPAPAFAKQRGKVLVLTKCEESLGTVEVEDNYGTKGWVSVEDLG